MAEETAHSKIRAGAKPAEEKAQGKSSSLWYLLAIFFGLLGGIVGFAVLREKDPGMAKNMLIVGIVFTILWPVIYFVLVLAAAFLFVTTGLI